MGEAPEQSIAVLGPGGVGGLIAAALDCAGTPVTVVARESTAELIAGRGLRVQSVQFGELHARPRAVAQLREPVDVLIVATKASGLAPAMERVHTPPRLVLPLLNGIEHLDVLRGMLDSDTGPERVLAGAIRVEADRPEPGVVVHSSPFLLIDMACSDERSHPAMRALAQLLESAGLPVRVLDSEAKVMWDKLVRLNALACTTSAFDTLLGEILATAELRAQLVGALEEAAAVARAEGADVVAADALGDFELAHPTLGSSMARDIAAGRTPELDAIPGAVLRAASRHGLECPVVTGLVAMIVRRTGLPAPRTSA